MNGIIVNGQNNNIEVDGGVNITSVQTTTDWTAVPDVTGIDISGAGNQITVKGTSSVTANSGVNANVSFANISDGSTLILDTDSSLALDFKISANAAPSIFNSIIDVSNDSLFINRGDIHGNSEAAMYSADFVDVDAGSVFLNDASGTLSLDIVHGISNSAFTNIVMAYDSQVFNEGTINIDYLGAASMEGSGVDKSQTIAYTDSPSQFTAMNASGNSVMHNDGTVSSTGGNTWGMTSNDTSTGINNGIMTHEGIWYNNDGNNLNCSSDSLRCFVALGGDVAALDSSTIINATSGKISVVNAGIGMLANGAGSTVINQGEINLTSNEKLGTNSPYLIGMAVTNDGTAVNDRTGIININATNGQAFYNDGSGTIVNYGTICTLGNCQDPDTYNPTNSDVSAAWRNGDTITDEGETLTLSSSGGTTDPVATTDNEVTNAGTVTGGPITVADKGHLTNKTTGNIEKVDIATGGEYTNQGSTTTVSVDGGVFNNQGSVTGQTGTTVAGSVILNSGSLNSLIQWASNAWNTGSVSSWEGASGSAVMNNETGGKVEKVTFTAASTFNNAGTAHKVSVDHGGTFNNLEGGVAVMDSDALWSGHFNNWGIVEGNIKIATSGDGHTLYNGDSGVINGQIQTANTKSKAINDGTINIDKTNNVAMSAHGSAKMVNNGTINVGTEGTTQTGMVGMQLESNATADAVIENNGTINIYASNSYAFSKLGSNGHIVNNGTVYIDDGVTGSGLLEQAGTAMEGKGDGGDGTEVHYVDFTAPEEPTITPYDDASPSSVSDGSASVNSLNGYVVGTSADGSAGKLKVSNASMQGVEINTGFAAGTDATSITFDNVVQGSNLTDANAITSTSVVWRAQGSNDASGNIDVTMSKNAYTDVATDSSVNNVAKALDAGYTNNELYTSLNVGTTAELNSALKQISGSQATTVIREARILSNRFSMLADAAPQMGNGLAFNVVAKGDPRAELGNGTQYDMLALRNTLNLSENQTLSLEYGIARLDGDGSEKAGDNGVTGGYSQFFGLKHQMAFDSGLSWNNALRYDVHQLDSSRSVAYNDVNKTANTDVKQQSLELRSEGSKTFTPSEGLHVTPYAGLKLRHTLEDGYKERNAGSFNLNMNSGSETAVDSIVGLKLDYAGKNGWSANMTLEGGPNLSYAKSQRTASLAGVSNQRFDLDDGQKGGGVNSLASVGVKYSTEDSALHLDAYQWKEDGISDKGLTLTVKKTF